MGRKTSKGKEKRNETDAANISLVTEILTLVTAIVELLLHFFS